VYEHREPVTLERNCEATMIPSGFRTVLPAGSVVVVHQTLGGNFTVLTDQGALARIDEKDAEALGKEYVALARKAAEAKSPEATEGGQFSEQQVWDRLRTVYDPEIPASIVDLGLVYDVHAEQTAEGGHRVLVSMTLTAPGCGIAPILVEDVRHKVRSIPGVTDVVVDVVFDPPWDPSRMSDAARLLLGFM
jgi:probable FeS assembly SUF system protein SufT